MSDTMYVTQEVYDKMAKGIERPTHSGNFNVSHEDLYICDGGSKWLKVVVKESK